MAMTTATPGLPVADSGPVLKLLIDRAGPANENFHRALVRLIAKQVLKDIEAIEATEDEVSERTDTL